MSRKKQRRRYTANGDPVPTMLELREFGIACDRWLAARGEHVGDFAEGIRRDCKLNQARTGQ